MKTNRINKISKPLCVELFAGAGGLMLGLEMSGFNTIIANEIHHDPCLTMKRNFPKTKVVEASIVGLSGKELLKKAGFSKDLIGKIDLLAGGPPCQGFSTAGMKNPADVRNNLIGEFIRMVDELKPRYFLMENVSGLATMYGGKLFEDYKNKVHAIGYKFHWKILKVADYGVPQMRKRLIVLGSRDGEPPPFPEPTHADPLKGDLFTSQLKPYITCKEAFSDLPELLPGEIKEEYEKDPETDYQKYLRAKSIKLYNYQASKHKQVTMDYYGLVPPGGTALDIPKHLRKKKEGIQRFPLNGLARTITTEPTDFLHPTMNRIPTIRELARLQSFPDWFEFLGQRTTGNTMRRLGYCAQSQQVGNAVPPLFGKALGDSIMKYLLKQAKKTT